jgi:hypothetical protein
MNHMPRNYGLKLLRREEGAVLILVAIAMFLFVIVIGVTVDYSRAQAVQARMQSALDAAGLDLVAEASLYDPSFDGSRTQWLQLQGARFFNANFPDGYLESSPVTLVVQQIVTRDVVEPIALGVNLTATSMDPTNFLRILGVSSVPVSAFSQVADLSAYRSEFAFVIDTSSAMSIAIDQGIPRIQVVQNALDNLITYFFGQNPHGVYGAIVPFAGAENVGTGHPAWMTGTIPMGWSGCALARDPTQTGSLPPNLTYDIAEDDPTSNPPISLFNAYDNIYSGVGINTNVGCPTQITTDEDTQTPLLNAVSGLSVASSSDVLMNLGVAWGWRLLSPHWRVDQWSSFMNTTGLPLDYNLPGRKKIMILVTSGQNSMDYTNPNDYNAYGHQGGNLPPPIPGQTPVDEINTSTLAVCSAFKNIDPGNNIIFTVGFGLPGTVNTPLLQACATSPSYSYTVSTNAGLYAVMAGLGREVQLILLRQ